MLFDIPSIGLPTSSELSAMKTKQDRLERVVEVKWEDTLTRHAWSNTDELPIQAWVIQSVGYVHQDNDAGMVLVESHGDSGSKVSRDHGCATFIPRSAILKVKELRRVREK